MIDLSKTLDIQVCPTGLFNGILPPMRYLLVPLVFLSAGFGHAVDTVHRLKLDVWSVERNAQSILSIPALSRAMQDFQATPGSQLLIRHPEGEVGSQWGQELKSWLIALGVPSLDLEIVSGSADVNTIEIEVVRKARSEMPVTAESDQELTDPQPAPENNDVVTEGEE